MTITGSNLVTQEDAVEQLSFFDELDRQKYEKLDKTVDEIRQRFGKGAIGLGGSIKSEEKP